MKSNTSPHVLNASTLSLTATSSLESTANAKAKDTGAGTVGIGAGAAINIVDDVTTAVVDSGAQITGAKDVTLAATATDKITTYAEAGAEGAAGSTLAFTANAAITLVDGDDDARSWPVTRRRA